ncbi:hypothetical protein AB1L42_11090 [Thalassoglobus sp. JC818]|uniref:hypothetical protein n=1 Tax=Thalassoglobus sp. JC818 TaxID=3232136 RepID=UPI003457811D
MGRRVEMAVSVAGIFFFAARSSGCQEWWPVAAVVQAAVMSIWVRLCLEYPRRDRGFMPHFFVATIAAVILVYVTGYSMAGDRLPDVFTVGLIYAVYGGPFVLGVSTLIDALYLLSLKDAQSDVRLSDTYTFLLFAALLLVHTNGAP